MMQFNFSNFIVCSFIFLNSINISQVFASEFSIKGKVLNDKNKPVESGNIIVLSLKDSSIIKGTFFIDGVFRLDGLSEMSFLLKTTSMGYTENIQKISKENSDSVLDIGTITLIRKSTALKEAEIVAKIPLFEMDGEKVKVNVENTGLSASGDALDVLRKSPGVLVSNTDNVTVFGKGAAIIYLDGLMVSSNEILKSIPASEIKNIEIIKNPSARYDASGRAVINIITRKNSLEGYNGNVIQNFLYGKYFYSESVLRLNYKKKKWALSSGYRISKGKDWSSDDYYRKFKNNTGVTTEMNNKIFETRTDANVQNYRIGANYSPDSLSTIGLQYNGFYKKTDVITDNINGISQNSIPSFDLQTNTSSIPVLLNNALNIHYTKKLDTIGSELFGAAQYGNFVSNNNALIKQNLKIGNNILPSEKRNNSNNRIQILTSQVDYNKAFSKKWKLESGLKNSYIDKGSEIKFENYSLQNGWVSDPAYYNGFVYKENVLAGYTELKLKINKFNARAGLRSELSNSDGFSKITNQSVIENQYLDFFPSAFLGYDFTEDLTTGLTYSSRIIRPTYQDMDPFINYIDSLSSFRGNPFLLPEYTHSLEASLIYLEEASITVGYSRTKGALKLVVDKLNDGTDGFIASTKNLDKNETYSLGLTIPYELDWWTTGNYIGYSIDKFSYESSGAVVQNSKPMLYIYLYEEFRFKNLFSLEITYEYCAGGADGIFIFKPFSSLSANIKRKFFNEKLTVGIFAEDILKSYVMAGNSNVPGYEVKYNSLTNTSFYLLHLNYQFGKLKSTDYKDKSVSQTEYDRIKMGK